MKSIKISLFATIALLLFSINIHAQGIIFCESADKYGRPINAADTFDVSPQGGILTVLLKPGHSLNTTVIFYQIYTVDGPNESLNNIERQEVQPEWVYSWVHLNFAEQGKYRIKAISEDNTFIGSGDVYIKVE